MRKSILLERTDLPEYSEVVEEIIPTFPLLPRYATDFLQFPTTRSMLRQSRTITGNNERLHAYLKKLQSQQCTTVLFLGGSVTKGHKAGGHMNAYPKFFCDWLNVDGIESFDLVFLEFNINDAFTPNNPHSLEDKGPLGNTAEYRSGWYFEILLRRLLLLRKPDPVAIVTFNADYAGGQWADKSVVDTQVNARKTLFRQNPEPSKSWISSLYEIPVFSASVWMLTLSSKKGMQRQFMRGNAYSTAAWHWGEECCHPHREGHLVLSLVLIFCIVEEMKQFSYSGEHKERIEHDFTADDEPRLRDPIYLSPEEDNLYVHNSMEVTGFDFTAPSGEETWKNSIVLKDGWSFYADNIDADKFGFIANNVLGKSHIALTVTGGKYGIVEISYLMSYENFGDSIAWISDPDDNILHHLCRREYYFGTQQRPDVDRLSGHWKEHASIPTVTILKQRIQEGKQKLLHVCLLPHVESLPWQENKFKLLGVRLY
ncbi:hypothetical protein ACHAXR_012891 [Thalassiosira sp. AJA248-18]